MRVYLDNAATTPLADEVVEAMQQVMKYDFGNPSSTHYFGRRAKALIETSRRNISRTLNCHPSEIIFLSGGTEADNLAILTSVRELGVKTIITTKIEHHAVGHTAEAVSSTNSIHVEYVKIDELGNVDLTHLESILKKVGPNTLVSLMHANNEIATLLPIKEVSRICRKYGALFHSDTVQTMGHYSFDLEDLDIDFITCAGHKLHGPKGIGFLYVNKKHKIGSLIFGGAQERGHRGGTENLIGIVGLAKAIELSYEDLIGHQTHVQHLKSYMIERLKNELESVYFHGEIEPNKSLYTVLNVSLPPSTKASMLLFTLDLRGVAVSGGSACSSGSNKGSHVLDGIGANPNRPNVRFSFSRYTSQKEVDYAIDQLKEIYRNNL